MESSQSAPDKHCEHHLLIQSLEFIQWFYVPYCAAANQRVLSHKDGKSQPAILSLVIPFHEYPTLDPATEQDQHGGHLLNLHSEADRTFRPHSHIVKISDHVPINMNSYTSIINIAMYNGIYGPTNYPPFRLPNVYQPPVNLPGQPRRRPPPSNPPFRPAYPCIPISDPCPYRDFPALFSERLETMRRDQAYSGMPPENPREAVRRLRAAEDAMYHRMQGAKKAQAAKRAAAASQARAAKKATTQMNTEPPKKSKKPKKPKAPEKPSTPKPESSKTTKTPKVKANPRSLHRRLRD